MIVGVAVRYDGVVHSMPRPFRHDDVYKMMITHRGVILLGPTEDGFLDDQHGFVNRRQAMLIAEMNDQFKPGHTYSTNLPLISEDIW